MRVSASQDETYTRCKRLWWFLYPHRMPKVVKGDLDFGTVIHSVCERYLLADDTGRVPETNSTCPRAGYWSEGPLEGQFAGEPVELYPALWDTVVDKRGMRTIPPSSAITIKKLVAKAIEEGILERRPGRAIEHEIERELIPGITMVGKIDVKLPGEIQDHKSTKAMKWAKSEKKDHWNYLGASLQMLDYAYEAIAEDPDLGEVRLRHNVFCKDPKSPVTRAVDVTVTRAQVAANWERLKKQAAEMRDLAELGLSEDQWKEVEGPSQKDACGAFGGCPKRRVCGGIESPAQYRKRIALQLARQINLQSTDTFDDMWDSFERPHPEATPRSNNMGIWEKRKADHAAKSSGPKATPQSMQIDGSTVAEAASSIGVEQEQLADEVAGLLDSAPPWAIAGCPACKGMGFNTKGSPCRICDSKSKKAGGETSIDYVIDTDGEGNVIWEAKDGEGDGGSAKLQSVAAEAKAQERIQLPEDSVEPSPGEEPKENVMEVIRDETDAAAELAEKSVAAKGGAKAREVLPEKEDKKEAAPKSKPKRKPQSNPGGRPKSGYFLYIDCMPVGVETTSIESIFAEMSAQLAESQGKDSYYDLEVFKRREAFSRALVAAEIDERFNRMHIVVRNPQGAPDIRAFVDAIVAIAPKGRVIQGVR